MLACLSMWTSEDESLVPLLLTVFSYNFYSRKCIIHKTACNYNTCTLVLNTLPVPLSICFPHTFTHPLLPTSVLLFPRSLPAVPSHFPPSMAGIRPRGRSQQQAGVRECKAIISPQHASFSYGLMSEWDTGSSQCEYSHMNQTHKSWHCSSRYYSAQLLQYVPRWNKELIGMSLTYGARAPSLW